MSFLSTLGCNSSPCSLCLCGENHEVPLWWKSRKITDDQRNSLPARIQPAPAPTSEIRNGELWWMQSAIPSAVKRTFDSSFNASRNKKFAYPMAHNGSASFEAPSATFPYHQIWAALNTNPIAKAATVYDAWRYIAKIPKATWQIFCKNSKRFFLSSTITLCWIWQSVLRVTPEQHVILITP